MKVTLSKNIGFCFGVKNAINIVYETIHKYSDKNIFIYGPIVHNKLVMDSILKERKVEVVDNIDLVKENSVLIWPAHGHNKHYDEILKYKNIIQIDTICDKVRRNSIYIEKELSNGHGIIYIGIKNHSEAKAALSLNENIIFLDALNPCFDFINYIDKDKIYSLVFQTTLNILQLDNLIRILKSRIPNLEISKEICGETRIRQQIAAKISPKEYDIVFVLGDKSSSNTTRLYEIIANNFEKNDIVMLNSLKELDFSILKNKKSAYLISGTSTPNDTVEEFYQAILNYNG